MHLENLCSEASMSSDKENNNDVYDQSIKIKLQKADK